jgi:hypothetical protein
VPSKNKGVPHRRNALSHEALDHFILALGAGGFRFLDVRGFGFFGGALQIKFQQAFKDLFVGEVGGSTGRLFGAGLPLHFHDGVIAADQKQHRAFLFLLVGQSPRAQARASPP